MIITLICTTSKDYYSTLLCTTGNRPNSVDTWDDWTIALMPTRQELSELDLLGSAKAEFCVKFYYKPSYGEYGYGWIQSQEVKALCRKDVTRLKTIYKNSGNWCNYTNPTLSVSNLDSSWLPKGFFFICGDRAWTRIPPRLQGGPCSLGWFAILTPKITIIQDLKNNSSHKLAHQKRSYTEFDAKTVILKLPTGAKERG